MGFIFRVLIAFVLIFLVFSYPSQTLDLVKKTYNFVVKEFKELTQTIERPSPKDRIKKNMLELDDNRLVLNMKNLKLTEFTDTNSMDPLLDEGAIGIEIKPKSPDEIEIGDIISFETKKGIVIHRVVEKGVDEKGVYFITKGDNNKLKDDAIFGFGKIRFEQVKGLLVGVLY